MTITFNDGTSYESASDYYLGNQADNSYHKELGEGESASKRPSKATEKPADEFNVDREHHVPLIASALMDGSGIAIDHRIPPHPEFEQFLHLHEATELPMMNHFVSQGMSPQDAYHEAHDKFATPAESIAVRAHAARNGLDPDEYLERYKQHWRDAATIASQPSERERHPDAHTTHYGLDEAELGDKWHDMQMDHYIHLAMSDDPHKPLQIDPLMGATHAKGPGKFNLKEDPVYAKEMSYASSRGAFKRYVLRSAGEDIGEMTIQTSASNPTAAYLTGAYGMGNINKNMLGPSAIREALRQYIQMNPEIKTIKAERISGARERAGTAGYIKFDVKDGKLQLSDETKSIMRNRAQFEERRQQLRGYAQERARPTVSRVTDEGLFRQRPGFPGEVGIPGRYRPGEQLRESMPTTEEAARVKRDDPLEQVPFEEESRAPWQEQPLRDRQGRLLGSPESLSIEQMGIAQYHNAMREIGLTPRSYEGADTGRRSTLADVERLLWRQSR